MKNSMVDLLPSFFVNVYQAGEGSLPASPVQVSLAAIRIWIGSPRRHYLPGGWVKQLIGQDEDGLNGTPGFFCCLVVTIGAWNHGKFNDFPFSWEWKIIPTDELIFFTGVQTTNHIYI
jgi:hypothetical protein